jgi:hypothetical protein
MLACSFSDPSAVLIKEKLSLRFLAPCFSATASPLRDSDTDIAAISSELRWSRMPVAIRSKELPRRALFIDIALWEFSDERFVNILNAINYPP